MRFYDVIAMGLAALSAPALAQTPSQHLFADRVLSPLTDGSTIREEVKKKYGDISPWWSLLIYDCQISEKWCDDPSFSFATVFGKAAGIAGKTNVPAALDEWFKSNQDSVFRSFFQKPNKRWSNTAPPFQLLAVVNRLDLAQWNPGTKKWEQAEVRFVYGLEPPDCKATPADFTLIIEFVLPPMSWPELQKSAIAWQAVSPKGGLAVQIKKALAAGRMPDSRYARLRTNHTIGGLWKLDQWLFQSPEGRAHLTRTTPGLDNQISSGLVSGANAADPRYPLYLSLWNAKPPMKSINVLPELFAKSDGCQPSSSRGICYNASTPAMPTPKGVCGALEPVRNTIALQQCTYCHGLSEAGTTFRHISNRMTGGSIKLSPFLTGRQVEEGSRLIPKPSIDELLKAANSVDQGGNKIFVEVSVKYNTWKTAPDGSCQPAVSQPFTRRFHDLARRALFLAAVLVAPANEDPVWLAQIQQFSTDFSH